ncbi:hypothetical protein [Kocuria palustris]|uniref:hypothetical protein n=1 Tax=Kocuria palustris TaxID=71999 RepID=UPI0011A1A15D|nr:hypothetical protein [Kocuria palustris]
MSAALPPGAAPRTAPPPPSPAALWITCSWLITGLQALLLPAAAAFGLLALILTSEASLAAGVGRLTATLFGVLSAAPAAASTLSAALGLRWPSSTGLKTLGIAALVLNGAGLMITGLLALWLLARTV